VARREEIPNEKMREQISSRFWHVVRRLAECGFCDGVNIKQAGSEMELDGSSGGV